MDSFKGSLTAVDACNAVFEGIKSYASEVMLVPMADGGEGTTNSIVRATDGFLSECEASGVFGEKINGYYGVINNDTAIVETAVASGITLVPKEKLNPLLATTMGMGEIIKSVLDKGYKKIIVGLGGSATNDGGMGALMALGVRFFDEDNNSLFGCGENLIKIRSINADNIIGKDAEIILACDVKNPFYGENGAAYVYGRQKGADTKMLKILDDGLRNFSEVLKRQFNVDISEIPGAGAAGGLAGGLLALTNAKIESGFKIISEITALSEKIKECDLVITGEGMTDYQTAFGKLPSGIGLIAKEYNKPVILISGSVMPDSVNLYASGITAMFSIINKPLSLAEAMRDAYDLLKAASENAIRLFLGKV